MVCNPIRSIFFVEIVKIELLIIECSQDLSEHYADKMIRVEQKVDNLRTATLG